MKSNSILSAWKPSLPDRTKAQGIAWPGTWYPLPPPTSLQPQTLCPNPQSPGWAEWGRWAVATTYHMARPSGSSDQLQRDTGGGQGAYTFMSQI